MNARLSQFWSHGLGIRLDDDQAFSSADRSAPPQIAAPLTCPLCGSHQSLHWHSEALSFVCQSCWFMGDTFHLYAIKHQCDYRTAVQAAREHYQCDLDIDDQTMRTEQAYVQFLAWIMRKIRIAQLPSARHEMLVAYRDIGISLIPPVCPPGVFPITPYDMRSLKLWRGGLKSRRLQAGMYVVAWTPYRYTGGWILSADHPPEFSSWEPRTSDLPHHVVSVWAYHVARAPHTATMVCTDDIMAAVRWQLWTMTHAPHRRIHWCAIVGQPPIRFEPAVYWSLTDNPTFFVALPSLQHTDAILTRSLRIDVSKPYPCQGCADAFLTAIMEHRLPAEDVVARLYAASTAEQQRAFRLSSRLSPADLQRLQAAMPHQRFEAVHDVPSAAVVHGKRITVAKDGWYHGAHRITDVMMYPMTVYTHEQRAPTVSIKLVHGDHSVTVTSSLSAVQRSPAAWLEKESLTHLHHLPSIHRSYRAQLWDIAHALSPPKVMSYHAFGWKQDHYILPLCTIDARGVHHVHTAVFGPQCGVPTTTTGPWKHPSLLKLAFALTKSIILAKYGIGVGWVIVTPVANECYERLRMWASWPPAPPGYDIYHTDFPYPVLDSPDTLHDLFAQHPMPHVMLVTSRHELADAMQLWHNWRVISIPECAPDFEPLHHISTIVAHSMHLPATHTWHDIAQAIISASKRYDHEFVQHMYHVAQDLESRHALHQYSLASRIMYQCVRWEHARLITPMRTEYQVHIPLSQVQRVLQTLPVPTPPMQTLVSYLREAKYVLDTSDDVMTLARDAWDFWSCMLLASTWSLPTSTPP